MAKLPEIPVLARVKATLPLLNSKIQKIKLWLSKVFSLLSQNKTLIGLTIGLRTVWFDRARLALRELKPNWHTSNGIVALLLLVMISNIMVARAQEDNREFLDVDPARAGEIVNDIAPYTPFDEDVDQAKLTTSGQAEGYINRPDFKETRKAGFSYTVQGGDTLQKIAERNGVNVATLLEANNLKAADIDKIKPGQALHIPPYNISDSTAWLEESQKIAQAKSDARKRAQQKRQLALADRASASRADRSVENADVHVDSPAEGCSIQPVPSNKGVSRGISRIHKGIDIRADTGSPILAAKSGVISSLGWHRGFGNTVVIQTGSGDEQIYGHASGFADIHAGQAVSQGQVIAYVGSSGWSTGSHLHIEEHDNGRVVNPFSC